MSYDLDLCDVSGKVLELDEPHYIRGGTYAVDGTNECSLNITSNYSSIICKVIDNGLAGFNGKTGAETISVLKQAIAKLGNDLDADYWKPTEGNVKQALFGLLALATLRPDGIWKVSY